MSRVDPKQATILIVILLILGSAINRLKEEALEQTQARQPAPVSTESTYKQPARAATVAPRDPAVEAAEKAEAARQAAADAALEHAKYLARYLNPGFTRKPGTLSLALVVVTETGGFNPVVISAIVDRLPSGTINATSDLFTPEFVSDGLFAEVFKGSKTALTKLELTNSIDQLLLAREEVDYTTNDALNHVVSAHLRLSLTTFPISDRGPNRAVTFSSSGAGFKPAEARSMAEERLLNQIATDTNFFTEEFLPHN